jgi:hypothetical protein
MIEWVVICNVTCQENVENLRELCVNDLVLSCIVESALFE